MGSAILSFFNLLFEGGRREGIPYRRGPHAFVLFCFIVLFSSFTSCHSQPGLDYGLNWSLNKNGVTPSGDAFRLTKKSDATQFGKAKKVAEPAESEAAPEAEDGGELSFSAFEAALEEVKSALEAAPALYVAEGDVPGTRIPCRVITDNKAVAVTAMGSILERMPKREPTELPVTCYFSNNTGSDFEGFVVEGGDGVIYPEEAVVADVVLTGKNLAPSKIWATIAKAAEEIQK